MEIQILPLIIVVAYLVGMLTVGAVVSKVQIKNAKDYMVAGRRMGLFMVAFSLSANNIGGGCTTGLAQKAFGDWGLSAVWYVLAASIAMIPLAYFAPKIRKTMAVTIPEVVGRRFGKFSSNFTAILSVLSLFCLTSSQIAASGGVINALIPSIPLNVCLIFAGIVIILYTTMGGMIADQISDAVLDAIIAQDPNARVACRWRSTASLPAWSGSTTRPAKSSNGWRPSLTRCSPSAPPEPDTGTHHVHTRTPRHPEAGGQRAC